MRIALTTDTHFGISNSTQKIHKKFLSGLQKESFDILIHTGDIASHKQSQLKKSLSMFREYLPEVPILVVLGNHDLWDRDSWCPNNPRYAKKISYRTMKTIQREWFKELGIHYLQDSPYIYKEEVVIYGYDGWYKKIPPPSNDKNFMPPYVEDIPIDVYLNARSHKSLENILKEAENIKENSPNCKLVCATHHSLVGYRGGIPGMDGDPRHLDFLSEYFDLVLFGHSHQELDTVHEYVDNGRSYSCRVVNAGSDYNSPKYKILEI